MNGRLKWARHAACKQKTNVYKIWIWKLHKPVGGTYHTGKDNIKTVNKLYDFNNLTRESSGRLQQSGESVKFHYNMRYLAQPGCFLKENLYLAISIHDVPLFVSTIMFLYTSALVTGKYVGWWFARQNLRTLRKTCTTVTLATKHRTWTAMEMSSGVCY